MVELVAKEGGRVTFKPILDDQQCYVFRTAVAFLSTLPAEGPLHVRVYSCSQRATPCPAFNSIMHCELRPSLGGSVWRGEQQERKRKRGKRALHAMVAAAADVEPAEDIDDDADWQEQIYALEAQVEDVDEDLGHLDDVGDLAASDIGTSSSSD
eukprot:3845701-Amphidinium_carterae.1